MDNLGRFPIATFGSAFAGIGGFDLGLERAGWECRWQIENDKFCNKVLEKRWPDVKRYGDVKEIDPEELEPVDLICGGFPCQDLSVAGKREGLSGERSGLFWELVRLIRGLEPRWLLIENVPGWLSSHEGEDFAVAIETLTKCGYGLAWRVLDSQFFGVPQRRRRVYIVGHLGGVCPPEILFESEGGEGDTAEGGKAGEDFALNIAASLRSGGRGGCPPSSRGEYIVLDAYNQSTSDKPGILREQHGTNANIIARPLRAGRAIADSGGDEGNIIARPVDPLPGRGPERSRETLIIEDKATEFGIYAQGPDRIFASEEANPNGVREASRVPRRVDLPVLGFRNLEVQNDRAGTLIGQGDATRKAGINDLPMVLTKQDKGSACACPDSPRYRALGNAVTIQVAEWIGRRIQEWGRI